MKYTIRNVNFICSDRRVIGFRVMKTNCIFVQRMVKSLSSVGDSHLRFSDPDYSRVYAVLGIKDEKEAESLSKRLNKSMDMFFKDEKYWIVVSKSAQVSDWEIAEAYISMGYYPPATLDLSASEELKTAPFDRIEIVVSSMCQSIEIVKNFMSMKKSNLIFNKNLCTQPLTKPELKKMMEEKR